MKYLGLFLIVISGAIVGYWVKSWHDFVLLVAIASLNSFGFALWHERF